MLTWSQFIKNFDKKLDVSDIEEFQLHLNRAVDKTLKSLDERYKNASIEDVEDSRYLDGYKAHLEDLLVSAHSSKLLGFELSIIALYKKVEIKIARIVRERVPNAESKKLSYVKNLHATLPFLKSLDGYHSFNELRLLNNDIKHGGEVSDELAKDYPNWKVGEELRNLDQAYERLLPGVKCYMSALVERIYSEYVKP